MKKNTNKGFTLIELLVVIAIIGILAGIILVSLNTARTKANDAAIKADLAGVRTAMEVYYSDQTSGSYDNGCTNADVQAYIGAGKLPASATATCNDDVSAYAVSANLSSGYWCVDSSGSNKAHATALGSATVCP